MRLQRSVSVSLALVMAISFAPRCLGHGTVVYPASRVHRVYQVLSGQTPSFPLAATAIQIDGSLSYYTWNELSRNIPQALSAGLPPGFDYSPWVPDGALASGGRTDPLSTAYPRTYAGLDQVSAAWPKTMVAGGSIITVDFFATAPHAPSVWDVWMTKPTWDPSMPLTWGQMEFLSRPTVTFANSHYTFPLSIPNDRAGHHVLWVAWQRNDPAGEVFFSTSDLDIEAQPAFPGSGDDLVLASGSAPALTSAAPFDRKSISSGNDWTVQLTSPLGTFTNQPAWVLGMPLVPAQSVAPLFGLPDAYVNPSLGWIHVQSPGLPAAGAAISFPLPIWAVGQSYLFQGLGIAPTSANGVYATTDAHQLTVLP